MIYTQNILGVNTNTFTNTAESCFASDSIYIFVNPTPVIQLLNGGGIFIGDSANLSV